jgi:Glycosyl transferases group 1
MTGVDVLVVSLGSTAGLRASDAELVGSLQRAGVTVVQTTAAQQRDVRTLALTDFVWARAARAAAQEAIAGHRPRAIIYSTITAALLWPRPGAIRFDSLAAVNRRGRHGVWQRPLERSRLREAPLLIPLSAAAAGQAPPGAAPSVVVGIPVEPSVSHDRSGTRDIAAITYAADPAKRNLGRILKVWRSIRRQDEELVVAGLEGSDELDLIAQPGIRSVGRVEPQAFRALLRRARVFVAAPRFEDYGIAQLEALADGCMLVTTPAPGPYVALPIARELDARLVDDDLETALRTALDAPADGYARRAADAMAPFRRAAIDRSVADELLPRLLS